MMMICPTFEDVAWTIIRQMATSSASGAVITPKDTSDERI